MSEIQENAAADVENISHDDVFSQRINKVEELKAAGIAPFGERFDGSQLINTVREGFKLELVDRADQPAVIAGRLMGMRVMGGSIFADIKDSSAKIQLFVNKKRAWRRRIQTV